MEFGSRNPWWEDNGRRLTTHEGLDFCCFADCSGRQVNLNEKTLVPAMYDGTVVSMKKTGLSPGWGLVPINIQPHCGSCYLTSCLSPPIFLIKATSNLYRRYLFNVRSVCNLSIKPADDFFRQPALDKRWESWKIK